MGPVHLNMLEWRSPSSPTSPSRQATRLLSITASLHQPPRFNSQLVQQQYPHPQTTVAHCTLHPDTDMRSLNCLIGLGFLLCTVQLAWAAMRHAVLGTNICDTCGAAAQLKPEGGFSKPGLCTAKLLCEHGTKQATCDGAVVDMHMKCVRGHTYTLPAECTRAPHGTAPCSSSCNTQEE